MSRRVARSNSGYRSAFLSRGLLRCGRHIVRSACPGMLCRRRCGCYAYLMCVTKLPLTSECRRGDVPGGDPFRSLVSENTERSLYRVLRLVSRGTGRSVDRECAGRNATSVKGIEPRQSVHFRGGRASMRKRRQHRPVTGFNFGVWRRRLRIARDPVTESAPPGSKTAACTSRPTAERERSASSRTTNPGSRVGGQGVTSKSAPTILAAEVRCAHMSKEVG